MTHLTLPHLAFSPFPDSFLVISHLTLSYPATLVNNVPGYIVWHMLFPSQIIPFPFVIPQPTHTEALKFCSGNYLLWEVFHKTHIGPFALLPIPENFPHTLPQHLVSYNLPLQTR